MAIDFPSSPTVGQQYTFNGVTYTFTSQGVWATAGASAIAVIGAAPQGRLTLQTATPVMTTTQAAKTTIFYTPYVGNKVPIYDGTNMVMATFAELSVATTDTAKSPAAIGASKVNDWFVWSDVGTVRVGHGPDWTSDTVRSAGTALVMVNGILLNNASITNGPAAQRGTYVGTVRSNASSTLDWIYGSYAAGGGKAYLNVWNMYNRVNVTTVVTDSTASQSYTTGAWAAFLGSTNNAVDFVCGLEEDGFLARLGSYVAGNAAAVQFIAIGYDDLAASSGVRGSSALTGGNFISGEHMQTVAPGKHTISAIEYGSGPPCSFFGGSQSGLTFLFRM